MAFTISYVYKATDNFSPTIKKISDQLEILNKKLRETTLNLRRVTAGFRAARVAGVQFHRQLTQMNNALHASNIRMRAMDRSIANINRRASNAATQGLRQMQLALAAATSAGPGTGGAGGFGGGGAGGAGGGSRRERIGGNLMGAGGAISAAVTLPAVLMGKAMFKAAADVESLEVSFTNTLKSADKAGKLMTSLKRFSKETIFDLPELGQTARLLIATGIELKDIMPAMRDLGDVAAGTGKPLTGIGLAFGQVRAKGRLMGEEVLQFAERGIPLLPLLAKKFDVTVLQMNKAISNGEVSFKRFREAWSDLVKDGGIFAGQAQAQAKALGGAFKVFQSSVLLASAQAGMSINKLFGIVDKLGQSGEVVRFLGDAFVTFTEATPNLAKFSIVTLLAAAALGAIALVIGALLLVVGPMALMFIGLGAALVGAFQFVLPEWVRIIGLIKDAIFWALRFFGIGEDDKPKPGSVEWEKQKKEKERRKRFTGGVLPGEATVLDRLRGHGERIFTPGGEMGKLHAGLNRARRANEVSLGAGAATAGALGGGTHPHVAATNKLIDSMDKWREEDRAIEVKITVDQDGRVEGASATGDVGVNNQL